MIKKVFFGCFFVIFFGIVGFVSASGCFHDAIYKKDQPAFIKSAVRMRDIACMPGSKVVRTIPTGEKVRIIAESEWYKIIDNQGNIGRVWRDFITKTNDWTNVPNYNVDVYQTSFCSTLDKTKCPKPSAPGVVPVFYYQAPLTSNSSNISTSENTTNNNADYISSQISSCSISDSMKIKLSLAVMQFKNKLDVKFENEYEKNKYITNVRKLLISVSKNKTGIIKCIFEYIIENL